MRRAFVLLPSLAVLALFACAKNYAEEERTETPPRADAGPDPNDGNLPSDAPPTDDAPMEGGPSCSGTTTFAEVADPELAWSAAFDLTSARLGTNKIWYVTLAKASDSLVAIRDPVNNTVSVLDAVNVMGEANEQASTDDAIGRLVLQSSRAAGTQLFISFSKAGGFGGAKPLPIDNAEDVVDPYLVDDVLYYARSTSMGHRALWRGQLGLETVGETKQIFANGTAECDHPAVTRDELEIFFRLRTADVVNGIVTYAQRKTKNDPFGKPITVSLPSDIAHPTWISPDGCELYVIDSAKKLRHFTRKGRSAP